MRILDPTHSAEPVHGAATLGRIELAGATVGVIDNAKPNFDLLADEMLLTLSQHHGVTDRVVDAKRGSSIPADTDVYLKLAQRCQLIICGSGD